MIPHFNYFPPAGAVVDQNEPRAQWTGRAWQMNGRPYAVPSTHHLVGSPNGPLVGWTYDWQRRAWMQPSPTVPTATPTQPHPAIGVGALHPIASQPGAQSQQATVRVDDKPAVTEKECSDMEKPKNVLEDLMKHPIAPVVGGVLLLASYITDEPQPPTIPTDLPEPVANQWQMVYAQNQQRFERRMSVYRDLGMVMLGYSGARSIVDVLHERQLPAAK